MSLTVRCVFAVYAVTRCFTRPAIGYRFVVKSLLMVEKVLLMRNDLVAVFFRRPMQRLQQSILSCGHTGMWWDKCLHEFRRHVKKWNFSNFSIVFCLIRGMCCTNYYLLKRIMDIACGHVPITLLCLSLIIIWPGRIFCIKSYLWIPTRCMCRCFSTYWCLYVCMFILTYCIVCTLFAGFFTWLISIFVLIFMLLSLSAFVRFLLKKLLAC